MKNNRKLDHIRICLDKDVESGDTGFGKFRLKHMASPEINFDDICMEIKFFGKKLSYPIIIEAMTGGIKEAKKINHEVAEIAQEFGIGFGVGSQRIIFDNNFKHLKNDIANNIVDSFNVRSIAPDVLLIANLGAVQLNYGYGVRECSIAVDSINADALALHLNPLQEVIQPEGNRNFSGLIEKINKIAKELKKPVIVKETGCGISYEIAKKLKVDAIDVAGSGGTSWGLIEGYRRKNILYKNISKLFSSWGIPTALAIKEVSKLNVPIIGSGGIRNGLDAAKALALGANCVGMALPILRAWSIGGKQEVRKFLEGFIFELKIAMFLTGSRKVSEIKGKIEQI